MSSGRLHLHVAERLIFICKICNVIVITVADDEGKLNGSTDFPVNKYVQHWHCCGLPFHFIRTLCSNILL